MEHVSIKASNGTDLCLDYNLYNSDVWYDKKENIVTALLIQNTTQLLRFAIRLTNETVFRRTFNAAWT